MLLLRKHREAVPALVLLAAWAFSGACTAWHTTSLQPQHFSAERSPEQVRLTLRDGGELTARHPVLVGDSLVWADWSDEAPRDSTRSAVLVSNIRQAKVHGVDAPRTIILLVPVGLVVAVSLSLLQNGIGN